jgi:hypothetical protein
VLDAKAESFVAYHPLPVRHGLTVGELARLFNGERKIGAALEVVRIEGWRRGDLFDRTGLTWVHPSPNMRSLSAALLYPGVGLLETTNLSVGRGRSALRGDRRPVARRAEGGGRDGGGGVGGVRFVPVKMTPRAASGQGAVGAVDRGRLVRFRPVRTAWRGVRLASSASDDWQRRNTTVFWVTRRRGGRKAGRPGATWRTAGRMS